MQNKTIVSKKASIDLKYFLSLLFFISFFGFSNAQIKKIKGSIVLTEKIRDFNGIYIQNLRTKNYTLPDIVGGFEIEATLGDSLRFSGEFLSEKHLEITPQIFSKEKVVVLMENEIIQLDEIVANPPLTGNLKTDLASVAYLDTISALYSRLGLDIKSKEIQRREKMGDLFPNLFGIPLPTKLNIGTLYKLILGYYKKEERLYKYNQLDETTKKILAIVPEDFFSKALKIPEEKVFNFVFFAVQTDKLQFQNLLKNNNSFDIKELLEKKSKIYLNRLQSNEVDSKNDKLKKPH
ncbi:Uncharacterised protein [Candidatus Ornithobacterium hominis]|uniref:DUF4369 domain-containing protein n=1 Tax=Candidatus Ornithobacterium hominis TaxID=2497989 RepID=A0A383U2W0_9FLAO|nr:hypothetical protein [Candidatus Ornithobacterium hominis]MCT7904974.1 hypothetical protein [Candidatus Ornithobacterium hominis]SZD73481.1 Uncharacterised protein [Candidatus Ornithobacterium hominis]